MLELTGIDRINYGAMSESRKATAALLEGGIALGLLENWRCDLFGAGLLLLPNLYVFPSIDFESSWSCVTMTAIFRRASHKKTPSKDLLWQGTRASPPFAVDQSTVFVQDCPSLHRINRKFDCIYQFLDLAHLVLEKLNCADSLDHTSSGT